MASRAAVLVFKLLCKGVTVHTRYLGKQCPQICNARGSTRQATPVKKVPN